MMNILLSVRIFEDNYPIFNLVGDNMFENPFMARCLNVVKINVKIGVDSGAAKPWFTCVM